MPIIETLKSTLVNNTQRQCQSEECGKDWVWKIRSSWSQCCKGSLHSHCLNPFPNSSHFKMPNQLLPPISCLVESCFSVFYFYFLLFVICTIYFGTSSSYFAPLYCCFVASDHPFCKAAIYFFLL